MYVVPRRISRLNFSEQTSVEQGVTVRSNGENFCSEGKSQLVTGRLAASSKPLKLQSQSRAWSRARRLRVGAELHLEHFPTSKAGFLASRRSQLKSKIDL